MKRDMDLVRNILFKIEKAGEPVSLNELRKMHENDDVVDYHVWLLEEVGFIDATLTYADNDLYYASIKGLTWDGQDYLDTMRDDEVWNKAKKVIKKTLGSTTLDLIKEVCHELSKKALMNGINLI